MMAGPPKTDDASDPVLEQNVAAFNTDASIEEYSREVGLWPIESALVGQYFPPAPAAVLDIGCGAGRTSMGLDALGYRVAAIDLADSLLAVARFRYPHIDFRRMDARGLEWADATFDAALFSYNGIDNIYPESSRIDCFRESLRVLKPGGVLVFSTHNLIGAVFSGGFWYVRGYWNACRLLWNQRRHAIARRWYIRYEDDHVQFSAPPGRTVRQLREAGFEILDMCGSGGERHPRRVLLHVQHVNFVVRRPFTA